MGFFDSTTKAVKFANIGDTITGTVSGEPRQQQRTKFGTNQPDFYDNGDPKMQILIPLQTPLRDGAEDDGARTLYVSSPAQKRAIGATIRESGATDIEVGGTLTVTFTGFDPASKNPANPGKQYTAAYTPPTSSACQPGTGSEAAAVPSVVGPSPTTGHPTLTGSAAGIEKKVQDLISMNLTDEQVATALGLTAEQITPLRASEDLRAAQGHTAQ